MSRFDQMLQQMQGNKTEAQIVAEYLRKLPSLKKEKKVVLDIIEECQKLSNSVQVAALLFAKPGNDDEYPTVYAQRCEVLEYLKLVNLGMREYFKNAKEPGGNENGNP